MMDFERYVLAICFIVIGINVLILIGYAIYGIWIAGPIAWVAVPVFAYATKRFADSQIFKQWYKEM